MADQEVKKRQTYGSFNCTGFITVDDKTFTLNAPGKNNANWIQNVLNPKLETPDGKSMFMNFRDGYDKTKGKQIYATIKDTTQQMIIPFADRTKEILVNQVDDKSFIKVGLSKTKVTNPETKKEYDEWVYTKFLTTFDVVTFLQSKFTVGTKVKIRLMGRSKYNIYNGSISKNYDLQYFYLLPDDDTSECEFTFSQDVLIESDSIDKSKWESDNLIKINGKLFQKNKKEYEVLVLPMIIRAETPEKKASYDKVLERYFQVGDETVRRIRLDGFYNTGYIAGNVTDADLPDDAKELIEDGFYTRDEVMKMYANKERVDEMLVRRPHMVKGKEGEKPKVDFSDKELTKNDLANLIIQQEEETIVPDENLDEELMKELEGL